MKITGQGFQTLLLVAVAAAGSKQVLDRWPLFADKGLAVVGKQVVEDQVTRFAAPNNGCREEAAALWTLRQDRREGSAPSLRQTAAARGLAVGTAVEPGFLAAEETCRSVVSNEFSTLTPENVMKFDHIHPARESYSFCDSDALVSYAAANHMQVRGHTLVWHQQLPEWLSRGDFSRDELVAILRDHRSIRFWGVTDRHSWIPSAGSFKGFGSALLLDEAFGFKPAYKGVQQALEGGRLLLGMR